MPAIRRKHKFPPTIIHAYGALIDCINDCEFVPAKPALELRTTGCAIFGPFHFFTRTEFIIGAFCHFDKKIMGQHTINFYSKDKSHSVVPVGDRNIVGGQ